MIIRKIDELGRVVIPIEMRTELNIVQKDSIEIEMQGQEIVIRKHEERCIFCSKKATRTYKNRKICNKCWEGMKKC